MKTLYVYDFRKVHIFKQSLRMVRLVKAIFIFTTTSNREIFVILNIVNMLLSASKSGRDLSSDTVIAFQVL